MGFKGNPGKRAASPGMAVMQLLLELRPATNASAQLNSHDSGQTQA